MALFRCSCKSGCSVSALIAGVVLGVLAAFLQITGTITVAPVFLWIVFGIAVASLGVLVLAAALAGRAEQNGCVCTLLDVLLTGILGSILLAVVLLAVGIVATSIVSAILVGLLVFFFALTLTSAACFVRCLTGCES